MKQQLLQAAIDKAYTKVNEAKFNHQFVALMLVTGRDKEASEAHCKATTLMTEALTILGEFAKVEEQV